MLIISENRGTVKVHREYHFIPFAPTHDPDSFNDD
jgi:hypothetical protein